MRFTFSLCLAILIITVLACSNESDDNNSYVVGQKCPDHITYDGICDGNKVIYCNNGVVKEDTCETECMIKESYTTPFAECYYECGDIDYRGKCASNGYDYCSKTEGLIHITCSGEKTCALKGDVYDCI